MKKKFLSVFLLLAIMLQAFCLISCSRGTDGGDTHVFFYNYSDTYITSVRASLQKQLEGAGVKYQNYDGNNNQTTQTEQVRTAITKGAKVLLVNLVNTGSADAANAVIGEAKKANVPVVFINRGVPDAAVES